MRYSVEVGPEAVEDLARLPVSVQRAILTSLRQLAAAPSRLARPTRPPYTPGMLYRAELPVEGALCLLDVVFQYGQDEQTLHISRVFAEYA
jgi:hypothetical protein